MISLCCWIDWRMCGWSVIWAARMFAPADSAAPAASAAPADGDSEFG